ncbi:MAG TPA: PQQ-dependent sugar dehydrogenase, partial [Mycobacteriales bacterium]|nr:PQQ-dependent sugar dehydrogenase [Mycobacteriales bacterium]
ALALYHGALFPALDNSLLVASTDGARLLRVRLDPQTGRPAATERLLQDRVDGISAVGISPDGAIYFTTTSALGRIVKN